MMNKQLAPVSHDHGSSLSPNDENRFAFFDVDETLINEKSMFVMLHVIEGKIGGLDAQKEINRLHELRDGGMDRVSVNRAFYALLAGFKQEEIIHIAHAYVTWRLKNEARFPYFIVTVLDRLRYLQSKGIAAVLVSGSCVDFLEPLRRYLGAVVVLATQLSINNAGQYTGNIEGDPVIGPGKLSLITQFSIQQNASLLQCYAFGDHSSDVNFLNGVGFPTVVGNNQILRQEAKSLGWEIIDAVPPPPQTFPLNNPLYHNEFIRF